MKKNVPVFLFVFAATYFFIAVVLWIFNVLSYGGSQNIRTRLHTFRQNHADVLIEKVFDNTFRNAKQCQTMPDPEREKCRKIIGIKLATLLPEEELADRTGNSWPHDLFFVKEIDETYYRLGWDGELKDISDSVDRPLLRSKLPMEVLMLQRNCNFFSTKQTVTPKQYACEVYESVTLGDGNKGYLVRLHPFTEEDEFLFTFILPIIGFEILTNPRAFSDPNLLHFFLYSYSPFLISLFVSLLFVYAYKKRLFKKSLKLPKK